MDELDDLAEARRSLQRILRGKGNDLLASALRRWATAPPFGEFVVGSGLTAADTAVFVVWESAESPRANWPYLARLMRAIQEPRHDNLRIPAHKSVFPSLSALVEPNRDAGSVGLRVLNRPLPTPRRTGGARQARQFSRLSCDLNCIV